MNRGISQSSLVQQIMAAENPNWWNINSATTAMRTTPQQQPPSPNILFQSSLPFPSSHDQLPESWSQLLLLGGLVGEDDQKGCMGHQFQAKKLEDWEQEILNGSQQAPHASNTTVVAAAIDVKRENYVYGHGGGGEEYQLSTPTQSWSQFLPPASSPQSCVTSFSNNMLDFSSNSPADSRPRHPLPDRSSECNSNGTGGVLKKARVQSSSNQTTFKVRKEKLGDRITALHQLVSPFGKTDTASVLLEAIGYIRFLQSQIEALSLPYLGNGSGTTRQQHSVQGERNSGFPQDSGQDRHEELKRDLRSRGLCLVPVSCTLQVGSDNSADYWAPALGGGCGGFR